MLFNIHADNRAVVRTSGRVVDVDTREEPKILQTLTGTTKFGGVKRVAFDDGELSPDDLVQGSFVTRDIDSFDEHARPLADFIRHVDRQGITIPVHPGTHIDEGKSSLTERFRDRLNRLLDLVRVEGIASIGGDQATQLGALDTA